MVECGHGIWTFQPHACESCKKRYTECQVQLEELRRWFDAAERNRENWLQEKVKEIQNNYTRKGIK